MSINEIEFTKIEKEVEKDKRSVLEYLAPDIGKVYVVSITRDGCPACKKQKPKISRLAGDAKKKYGSKVIFDQIHVKYSDQKREESLRCKDLFDHYFYPTNLILLKTKDRGAIEYYRNASASATELKRNIKSAFEVATMLEKE
ncbi:thioredoxin family protein [Candidatus Bathyarchaeota archaeon]|nr:thioredoxin family protein [Candidatus Bathyarchaeota archaeon]